jgi:hypothetical protein
VKLSLSSILKEDVTSVVPAFNALLASTAVVAASRSVIVSSSFLTLLAAVVAS